MTVSAEAMKKRTKRFALEIIRLISELPMGQTSQIMGRQLLRCGTSVGANYRAVCRAKSKADFISKMMIVEEEADECAYWLDLLSEVDLLPRDRVISLIEEAYQIVAITVSSINTARKSKDASNGNSVD
jgi:four helix bundle protein